PNQYKIFLDYLRSSDVGTLGEIRDVLDRSFVEGARANFDLIFRDYSNLSIDYMRNFLQREAFEGLTNLSYLSSNMRETLQIPAWILPEYLKTLDSRRGYTP